MKVDIIKIPDLTDMMSTDAGTEQLVRRFGTQSFASSFQKNH
jgi:hypothetical protein